MNEFLQKSNNDMIQCAKYNKSSLFAPKQEKIKILQMFFKHKALIIETIKNMKIKKKIPFHSK